MQSGSSSAPSPEAILEWLQKEMGYRSKSHAPSVDSVRKICRGNMIPLWGFLINRAKSEKTVESIRRNITVHGSVDAVSLVKEESKVKESEREVERLRNLVRRQRKDLKARMLEVSREEAERKRMLDERGSYRHKQVMLEAYDQQCDEAARIFAEYHKRLKLYVNQASEREAVYSSVRGSKSADDDRSVREACESLASRMVERICNSFPAYEGRGVHSHPELETAKLSFEYDGEISDEMRGVVLSCLSSPPLLLQAIAAHTLRLKNLIAKEIERVDVRADAETLRYKYENNRVMEISSSDVSSPLSYQFNGNGKIATDTHSKGSNNQLLERQKAHVQQFLGTEDALNKAAEARVFCQKLKNRLQGSADTVSSHSLGGGTSQNVRNLRQLELDVWGKEREAAGLRASLNTLLSEIQRLNKLCAERKEAEHSLNQKKRKEKKNSFSMATSVDNRHYPRLSSALNGGVVHSFKPPLVPSPSLDRDQDQSVNVPTEKSVDKTTKEDRFDSSDDEDESHNRYVSYYKEMVLKSNSDLEPSALDSRDESTADNWIHRNSSMVRLTGKHPFNAEAPLPRLMHHGFITPVPLHYVRNHGGVPKAEWSDWSVEVTGLVKRPARLTMEQLISEFPSREFPVTLVCAGNRRKEQNMVKQTIGFNWGSAGVSTSLWRGVALSDVLRRCGVYSKRGGALNVCFEGAEDLPGGGGSKYGTSIKKEMAMDPARDIILAYMQNGELLTPDHGFPVRVIIPGFIGGRMVKWLKRIIVTPQESDNYYHYKDNRVLPSYVDAELANEESWWYRPEYIINELNINSVITTPGHEEILPINAFTTQKPYTLKGYAYSGGGKKVTRVEVTLDGGETWSVCELDHQEKPNKYGKFWCWCFWSLDVEVLDLLSAKEVAVRAWDESLNTQPEKLIWNLMGMMNNCWFRIKTNVCKPHRGEIGIVFEHPTRPGNQSGGWMAKERQIEKSSESHPTLKKSVSTPFMNTASKMYSMSEVRKHNSAESAWIIVHGHIYDCTRFLKDHPGGSDSILINAGTDCTEEFEAIHSDKAKKLLEDYRIGELITTGYDSSPNVSVHGGSSVMSLLAPIRELAPAKNIALVNPREKVPVKLIEKTSISHDVRRFRFALPSEDQQLGLPVGKHIFLCATINDKLCLRAYTPTSTVDAVGYIDLVIKVYFKNVHPRFPNGGLMSQHLDSLPIGAVLDIKGPLGHIEYQGRGKFMVSGKPKFANKLAMLAGGTGITPIYQVIQSILSDPEDETEMFVVYANRTEDDILVREELEGWASKFPDRLKIWYVVEIAKEGWEYSTGFITEAVLREHVPEGLEGESLALACGPPPMIQFALQPNLEKMGYDIKEDLLIF